MRKEEQVLEFDKIKSWWGEYALTAKAKQWICETDPILSERALTAALRETTQSRQLLEKCGNPPLSSMDGLPEILLIASKGDCLAPWQLEKVKVALIAVRRLKDYLERGKAYDNSLAYYEENLNALEDLRREIDNAIYNDEVTDHASARLKDIRRDIQRCEEKMREKAEQVIRNNKEYMSDSFSTFRNGRICVPVKKEYKLLLRHRIS